MANADVQIGGLGSKAAPLSYTIPDSVRILLKSVRASFNGAAAGGDFLPAVELIAPGGASSWLVGTDSAVAAGGSADVTFAPFLRNAAGSSGTGLLAAWELAGGLIFNPHSGGNFGLANNTVAEIGWLSSIGWGSLVCLDMQNIGGGSGQRVTVAAGGFGSTTSVVTFHVKIQWPSFAGRRYVEVAPNNGAVENGTPFRLEGSATPQDDIQVLTGTFVETTGTLTGMVVNCFQASGVTQTFAIAPSMQLLAVGVVS